jgi:glutamine synthetase
MNIARLSPHAENPGRIPGRVARLLDGDPKAWRVEDLVDLCERHEVQILSLMHVGSDGALKALDFPISSRDQVRGVLVRGERADGSSLFAETGIPTTASDIVLRPRIETAFFDPFAEQLTLAVLCEHLNRDGQPLDESPQTIVRRAYDRLLDQRGVDLHALGEVEYFLGRPNDSEGGYGSDDHGYHATSPFVFGAELRRKAMALLTEIGVPIKYGHSEVGWMDVDGCTWEQHEIELALAPLPQAADGVLLTEWVLRNLAARRGMRCSFDPVVQAGHAGSGLHFHFSPMRDGQHLGGGKSVEEFSDEALALIAGLVECGGALMAWGNRNNSSFVRLNQGKEAPDDITWGCFNRRALVRLPIQARSAEGDLETPPTIEFRLPDGSAHPHLLVAGVAQAMRYAGGLDDLRERVESSESGTEDEERRRLPVDRQEVALELLRCREWLEADGVLPPELLDATLRRLGVDDRGRPVSDAEL